MGKSLKKLKETIEMKENIEHDKIKKLQETLNEKDNYI